jgi:transcriptional regulator with XRE-family HTH domain
MAASREMREMPEMALGSAGFIARCWRVAGRREYGQGRYGYAEPLFWPILNAWSAAMDAEELNPLYLFFAAKLKRLRLANGWSQEALGKRIGYSGEMVSKVEKGDNPPSPEFARALDAQGFPGLGGLFTELLEQAGDWRFRTLTDAEKRASVIRTWNPLLVPGLFQTADYARAIIEAWRGVDGDQMVDADVAARLERQSILDRPLPPSVGVVIDETVLYRGIGGAKVMHDQLLHLADASERSRVTIQVLPAEVAAHVGLMGAFIILSFPDAPGMVYFESPDRGEITTIPRRLARLAVTWDVLRDEALGARASRDLFRKVAKDKWTA